MVGLYLKAFNLLSQTIYRVTEPTLCLLLGM